MSRLCRKCDRPRNLDDMDHRDGLCASCRELKEIREAKAAWYADREKEQEAEKLR